MSGWYRPFILSLVILVSGCAGSMVRSDVTVFQEWPADMREKIFVFERTREQDNNLEYRNYENLVRTELLRLGFAEASVAQPSKLKVMLSYGIRSRDVRVIESVAPEPFWSGGPGYGHRWRGRGYYGPYYDPFWPVSHPVEIIDSSYQVFSRQLKVTIAQMPAGKKLFDVTVSSEGSNGMLATVMPYLVRSAFIDFPGTSGVPRRIELRMQEPLQVTAGPALTQ